MRKFLLTACSCLLFSAVCGQETAPTTSRRGLFGRGEKTERKTEPQTPAAKSGTATPVSLQPAASTTPVQPAKAAKHAGAHLNMPSPTCDFGDVPRKGGDLTHEIAFTNDGTAPLVLTRIITSCSCLKAAFPKRPVAPGESGVISITYEPHKSEPGAFNKVIQVYSNSVDGRDVITVQGCSIDGEVSVKVKADGAKVKIK